VRPEKDEETDASDVALVKGDLEGVGGAVSVAREKVAEDERETREEAESDEVTVDVEDGTGDAESVTLSELLELTELVAVEEVLLKGDRVPENVLKAERERLEDRVPDDVMEGLYELELDCVPLGLGGEERLDDDEARGDPVLLEDRQRLGLADDEAQLLLDMLGDAEALEDREVLSVDDADVVMESDTEGASEIVDSVLPLMEAVARGVPDAD